MQRFGKLDVLINNAGEQHPQENVEEITREQIERTFRTNIFAQFFMVKAALPHLQKGASIVNIASVTAYEGNPRLIDYSATKGAIVSFTRALSNAIIERGIRVNAVAPGPIWTPLIPATFPADKVKEFGKDTPMKRPGQPMRWRPPSFSSPATTHRTSPARRCTSTADRSSIVNMPRATWKPHEKHGELTERGDLPDSVFAYPKKRKEPMTDASHVRNAIARFDQVTGVSDEERAQAFANIKKAAKHYGVEMSEDKWKELGRRPSTAERAKIANDRHAKRLARARRRRARNRASVYLN